MVLPRSPSGVPRTNAAGGLWLNENPRSILGKKRGKNVKKRKGFEEKSGKNEKKAKKCPVFVQKNVQNFRPDTNTSFNVKIGSLSRLKFRSQNEGD